MAQQRRAMSAPVRFCDDVERKPSGSGVWSAMVDGEAVSVSNWERGDLNTIVAEEANPVVAPDKACC
jgi:hypothetical protein